RTYRVRAGQGARDPLGRRREPSRRAAVLALLVVLVADDRRRTCPCDPAVGSDGFALHGSCDRTDAVSAGAQVDPAGGINRRTDSAATVAERFGCATTADRRAALSRR